jgi:hypothetical protein
MEKSFVSEYQIKRPKEVKYFQVSLPDDATKIVGVECAVNLKENFNLVHPQSTGQFEFARNQKVGVLKLQSCDKSNIFFSTNVNLDTNGYEMNDFTEGFEPNCYTHQAKMHEVAINVPIKAPVVYGVFKDNLIAETNEPWEYTLKLFIWYEISNS